MELGQLYWSTGLNTSGLQKDSKKASGILGKLGKGMGGMFNPAALGISAVAGAALKLGKDAYDFSKRFNSAMLEVKTISAAAQEDFKGMSEAILDISIKGVNDDAEGLSKAMYQIVSAGYDGAQGLSILEASAKAATGGVTDTMTAADGLTTVLNAWGLSADQVNTVSDQMFTTVKLGKTTMGELGQNIAKVAPLAAATGVEFEQVAAATATLTSMGTKTTEAFTQMKAGIVALNKNLGDGWAETMTLQEGFAKMRDMAGGSDTKLQELTGSSEAMLAVLAMTGDNAAKAAEHLEGLKNSAGAANEAFNTMGEDVDVIWKQVGNQFKAQMTVIGDGLISASKGLAKFLSASMTGRDQLSEDFSELGENVDSFSERMKVLKNEGNGFWSALAGAATRSNESIQKVVDNEKAEVQATVDEIAALNDEYNRLQESGASETELSEFKKNLVERYTAMKDATDAELEIANKRAKQSKVFAVATLGLGSGTASAEGIKAKDIKDQADNLAKTLDAVMKLGAKEAGTLKPEVDIAPVFTLKNINDLEKELKALQDRQGSILVTDFEAQLANQKLIDAKQKEIDDIQEKLDKRLGKIFPKIKTEKIDINKLDKEAEEISKDILEDLDDELDLLEDITEEEKKQLEQSEQEIDLIKTRFEYFESIRDTSHQIGNALHVAANYMSKFDEDTANILANMGDVVGMTGDLAEALKSTDKATFDSVTSLIALLFEINSGIANFRDSLLDKVFGKDVETRAESVFRNMMRFFGSSLWEFPKIWSDIWKSITGDFEDIKNDIDVSDLISPSDITNSIVDGLLDGFKLAEDGMGDFAETFGELMQDAGSTYLKKLFEDKYLQKLMEKFMDAAEGGLTEEEIAQFREDYRKAIEEFSKYTDEWNNISEDLGFGNDVAADTASSMGDAISGITEQTAGLIEGQFNALRINTLDILSIMAESSGHLSDISSNTAMANKLLASINERLTEQEIAPQTSYVK